MEPNPVNNENCKQLIEAHEKRVAELEKQMAEADRRAKSFEKDWSNLFDKNKTLREENQRMQHDYESLRLQKGGFGFRTLLASGLGGFVTALLLCFVYLKLKPKPDYVATFERFRRENLFNYELQLSNGEFDAVEAALKASEEKAENQLIKSEIIFSRKIVGASKRYCKPGN